MLNTPAAIALRQQILADQAARAEGDTHTANTIRNAIAGTFFAAGTEFRALTAAEQRSLFGAAPFGRMPVRWNARRGVVETHWRTLSRDTIYQDVSVEEVARACNEGRKIRVQR